MIRRVCIALALVCLPSLASAAKIPYTGSLFDAGMPVTGNRHVQLDVYDVASGGAALHSQAESLAVIGGVFHTVLDVADATWFGGERWIGVSINGAPELSPRVKYHEPARPGPMLFEGTPASRTVTSDSWTRLDSVTVTAIVPGFVSASHAGSAVWTGSVTTPLILFAISPTTPSTHATQILPQHTGSQAAVNFSVVVPVDAGSTKLYTWARIVTTGQSYSVRTGHFQALYLPR